MSNSAWTVMNTIRVKQLRRKHMGKRTRTRPLRKSVLGSHYSGAVNRIAEITLQMAAAMVQADFDRHDVVKWLFSEGTRAKLTAAYGLAEDGGMRARLYQVPRLAEARVWLDFRTTSNIPMLLPLPTAVDFDPVAGAPLIRVVDELRVVHQNCAVVGHVLEWMDANATAGAMRYYWPSVAALAPGFELGECPVSYQEPEGIHTMSHLLREAARIVAEMQMVPETEVADRGLSIMFYPATFTRCGVEITAPQRAYFL